MRNSSWRRLNYPNWTRRNLNNAFRVSSPKSFADSCDVFGLDEGIIVNAVLFRPFLAATVVTTLFLCVPVEAAPELENQDRAFSLLIKGYGEVQSAFIENDYQARLEAAEAIANPVARRHACDLAKQERETAAGKTQATTHRDGRRLPLLAPTR